MFLPLLHKLLIPKVLFKVIFRVSVKKKKEKNLQALFSTRTWRKQ